MTVKEFVGMQAEFAPKQVKFTVEGVPLTTHNFDLFADKVVVVWAMYVDGIIDIVTKYEEC